MVLEYHGVPTAPCAIVDSLDRSPSLIDPARSAVAASPHSAALAAYPIFAKPAAEGSSKGISKANKITTASELEPVVNALREGFPEQEILLESFLSGDEVAVSILGTGADARVIGVGEVRYGGHAMDADENFQSFGRKMMGPESWPLHCEAVVDMKEPRTAKACETALAAYRALGCRDLARVDLRFDHLGLDGKPYVLEVWQCDSYAKEMISASLLTCFPSLCIICSRSTRSLAWSKATLISRRVRRRMGSSTTSSSAW